MKVNPEEITAILKREIEDYQLTSEVEEIGTVLSVGDGIAQVFGLTKAMAGELVTFEGGVVGMILNLDEASVGVVL
ncbi:MAG: F0F1 ATP synthase subunit alpha, partial [Sulfobacillus sp.]